MKKKMIFICCLIMVMVMTACGSKISEPELKETQAVQTETTVVDEVSETTGETMVGEENAEVQESLPDMTNEIDKSSYEYWYPDVIISGFSPLDVENMLTEKEFFQICEERGFVQSAAIYGADYNAQGDWEPVKFVNQTAENETILDDEHIANDDKHPEYHATFTDSRENMWFVYYANGSMTARLYGKNYEDSKEMKENPWIIAEADTFMRFDEYSKAYMQQSGNPDVAHVVIVDQINPEAIESVTKTLP